LLKPKKLYPNLTPKQIYYSDKRENTITIPRSYLVDNEYVIVMRKESKSGLSDYQKVEVLEGLKKKKPFIPETVNYKLILDIAFHLLRADLNKLLLPLWVSLLVLLCLSLWSVL
jgi:hypothetical protein